MHSVVFKAELKDPALACALLQQAGATPAGEWEQVDTCYRVPAGRFKKRTCTGRPTEYLFYDRPDNVRPRLCHYTLYSESEALARFGSQPLPVAAVVRKHRRTFLLGPVRVHLDRVADLGGFVLIDAMVTPFCSVVSCHQHVARAQRTLALALGEPIALAYADLLQGPARSPS